MTTLEKNTGIDLKKGSSIRLEKNGMRLQQICIGLNWSSITRSGFFRTITGTTRESVHLDGAVSLFENGDASETVCFRKLVSSNGSIRHLGDDSTGNLYEGDDFDKELITLDLTRIADNIDTIYISLNSFKGQDFGDIPYTNLRILEGTSDNMNEVLATFSLPAQNKFKGYVSMIMGKLKRVDHQWEFTAIGDPVPSKSIPEIVEHITNNFLKNKS